MSGPGSYWFGEEEKREVLDVLEGGYLFRYGSFDNPRFRYKAYTFVASYSAIIFAGGVPVLAEIDDSLTLDPADIERRITPRTRAIMPVHMLGNPSQMDAIMAIAEKHGLLIVVGVGAYSIYGGPASSLRGRSSSDCRLNSRRKRSVV